MPSPARHGHAAHGAGQWTLWGLMLLWLLMAAPAFAVDGTALLNGATTTLTRAAASNSTVAIIGRASAADSYVVTGS